MPRPKRASGNHFTRGGQITFHSIRMFFQVNNTLVYAAIWSVIALTGVLTWLRAPDNAFWSVFYYWRNHIYASFGHNLNSEVTTFWSGKRYVGTLASQLENTQLIDLYDNVIHQIQINFLIAIGIAFAILMLAMSFFKRQGEKQSEDFHVRGFQYAEPKVLTNDLKKRAKKLKRQGVGNGRISDFKVDGLALFKREFEVQHMLIDGTTGAGKSVMLRKLLRWIRKRGDKAIIYDKGCTFTSKFFDPSQDTLLNPFDERCANWDVWCDAKDAPDFENIANALIPQHGEGDPFWVDSARTIFSSAAYRMSQDDKPCSTARLLSLILTSELETLGNFLQGTESASLVSKDIKKTAISIKSVLATYIKSLRFLDGLDDKDAKGEPKRKPFSITDWVQDDKQKGFLFLSSNAQQHASLRPLISTWLAIASNAILGLKADEDRRIWVIMDEMPSLHKLPELDNIISEVRKFGGCYVIGLQSYAQLVKTYGKNTADVIFDLLNSRFYFRAPSAQMAQISSKDLGEQEVDVSRENISYGANALRDGVSIGHQTVTRPVVSSSEIQAMDDLQCYLRVPGSSFITQLELHFDKMRDVTPAFIKREHTLSPAMIKAYQEAVYCECVAPGLFLSEEERNALSTRQSEQFDTAEEMKLETAQIKEATQSKTVKNLVNDDAENLKSDGHYQKRAQQDLEESAISQDIGMDDISE
ncbi:MULTISPECIES: type IV conjugative transfer system coupling protein TraD [Vibrio]|uniref:Type IV conjugative transfer system coupling protein TraD n=19 Tax=Vibrionaceae TaxID=641 RepID=A0A2N7NN47_9VIBR|nr:type IV conjugative transfer system coupling protein TraD [Vibrio tasmaniensis]PMP17408.1 type IV conjugative transfer system coupling protein TraD [Vibrio tasmaniensis]TKG37121.1 type IV conjugative transfer system coupling protein TraD [Vibrio tasmaniensis]TKG45587.1 type IV conjugative transfer system coupling protein TraD [Vibrio tasmaniensis]CAH7182518.1 Type IV conjugative transfer system coupling protein TraD [Vibrio chagasii]